MPDILGAMGRRGALVLHAPTGAGKTTRVPPALLAHAGPDASFVVVEPRRVACRAAARRMAEEHGEPVGQTFGYHVRHERKVGRDTRLVVMTPGMLLRRLVRDPFLEDIHAVVIDEAHERSLDVDLVLSMVAHLRREVRPDLMVAAMSATAQVDAIAGFLDAEIVRSSGRSHPVDIRYLTRPTSGDPAVAAAEQAHRLASEVDGDVLVFLPGVREIRRAARHLAPMDGPEVVPLHGRLTAREQDHALRRGAHQRIVLATNVAETSVTLPGVRAVVDTGLVRTLCHDPGRGLDQLVVGPNSQASADQRAGRAGRTAPGIALRMWTQRQHAARPAHDTPEVRRVDLAGVALTLRAWGEPSPAAFPWLDPPPAHALEAADDLLGALGALRGDALTPIGESMAKLPAHPRLARMLVEAHRLGAGEQGAWAAALLGERIPTERTRPASRASGSDIEDMLDHVRDRPSSEWKPVHPPVRHRLRQTADQLLRSLSRLGPPGSPAPHGLRRALLAGFPDRLAIRRRPHEPRIKLARGRGAVLHPHSAVTEAELLVALDVMDQEGAEALVRLASAVETDWLPKTSRVDVRYDEARDRVVASEQTLVGSLVVRERPGTSAPKAELAAVLFDAARRHPARAWPSDDRDLQRLVGRLRFLQRVMPGLGLPSSDPSACLEAARHLVHGCRSLAELRRAAWSRALLDRLDWSQRKALDQHAPESLQVPSGSNIRLTYPDEGPPILAVRIQEMFGCAQTPKVAGHPVLLHLLAPNQRPQQVTDDLAGFWERTYPEVRKELRRRYPKHAWPDDPLAAPPERRPRRRR
jgi:ATP-dependent helicase HrpB